MSRTASTVPETSPIKSIYALYLEKLHAEAAAQLDYCYETENDQHRAFAHAEMLDFMRRTEAAPERMADLLMTVAPNRRALPPPKPEMNLPARVEKRSGEAVEREVCAILATVNRKLSGGGSLDPAVLDFAGKLAAMAYRK